MKPLAEQPAYAEALSRINEIDQAMKATADRIAEIDQQLIAPTGADHLAAAARILAGLATRLTGSSRPSSDSLRTERRELHEQLDVLILAKRMQHDMLSNIAQRLSREACTSMGKEHRALAAKALQCLRAFDDLQHEERRLLSGLYRLGYETECGGFGELIAWPQVGTLETLPEQSLMSVRVRELQAYVDGGLQQSAAPASSQASAVQVRLVT